MRSWNPNQYLRFGEQRTRPCRDLAERISARAPRNVIDLGCGPGNSTQVLAERWPQAQITGLDSSPEMIAQARQSQPRGNWEIGDIATWATRDAETFDVVFSNAALQWVDDHATVFPQLLKHVSAGGALAIQMPHNHDNPAQQALHEVAESGPWRERLTGGRVRDWHVHDPEFYYDLLAPHTSLDIWETEYMHVLAGPEDIVQWYRGTALRPFLAALDCEQEREKFLEDYLNRLEGLYPLRVDGRVLFPFRRLFMIAYKLGSRG